MSTLSTVGLFVAFLATCGAVLVACEARRLCDPPRWRIALACAIPLAILTSALAWHELLVYAPDPHQSDHLGFGPDWHCLGSGVKGGGFCFRYPKGGPRE